MIDMITKCVLSISEIIISETFIIEIIIMFKTFPGDSIDCRSSSARQDGILSVRFTVFNPIRITLETLPMSIVIEKSL